MTQRAKVQFVRRTNQISCSNYFDWFSIISDPNPAHFGAFMISPNLQHQSERLRRVIKTAKDNFYSGAEIWAKCRLLSIGQRWWWWSRNIIKIHIMPCPNSSKTSAFRSELRLRYFTLMITKLGQKGCVDTWRHRYLQPGDHVSCLPIKRPQQLRTGSGARELHISVTISDSTPLTILWKTSKHQSSVGVEIRNPTRWIILLQPACRSSIWNIEKIFWKIFRKMQNCTGK